jgi:putative phosphoesterase
VKIGVLADIHANLPALRAVLKAMPQVDLLLCCGDILGYYPDVNEVCELLREKRVFTVRGNHDAYVTKELQPSAGRSSAYQTEWTRSKLDIHHQKWLATLPVGLQFKLGTVELIVRHASPWDEETYVYPDSPCMAEITLESNEILILGHTHHPMWVKAGEGNLLNPGSVGQPRDWNPQASFAIIETRNQSIQIMRVSYDVVEFQKRLESLGWDENLVQILGREKRGNPPGRSSAERH